MRDPLVVRVELSRLPVCFLFPNLPAVYRFLVGDSGQRQMALSAAAVYASLLPREPVPRSASFAPFSFRCVIGRRRSLSSSAGDPLFAQGPFMPPHPRLRPPPQEAFPGPDRSSSLAAFLLPTRIYPSFWPFCRYVCRSVVCAAKQRATSGYLFGFVRSVNFFFFNHVFPFPNFRISPLLSSGGQETGALRILFLYSRF